MAVSSAHIPSLLLGTCDTMMVMINPAPWNQSIGFLASRHLSRLQLWETSHDLALYQLLCLLLGKISRSHCHFNYLLAGIRYLLQTRTNSASRKWLQYLALGLPREYQRLEVYRMSNP